MKINFLLGQKILKKINFNFFIYNIYQNENKFFDLKNILERKNYKIIILENYFKLNNSEIKLTENNLINELKKGFLNKAIAFCIIHDGLIIHTTWLATNDRAKKYVDVWHNKIDWTLTAVWGNAFTLPEYRKNGLYLYTQKYIQTYLFKKDIKYQRFSVKKVNTASIGAINKLKPNIISLGINIKMYKYNFRFIIKNIKKND